MKKSQLRKIIKEEISKVLTEDMEVINRILDKISAQGKDSLTPEEKGYLDKYSKGNSNLKSPYPLSDEEVDNLYYQYPELENPSSSWFHKHFELLGDNEDIETYKASIGGKEYKVEANTITGEEKWYNI
jgi:hypothetical protein